ncbi:MAG TPA: DUF2071 domain-containing protein [Ardenticatenaceae bacterium]|nr:DUF2071 domain-containing protein [Ardenticatenaceae bacterium]
MDEDEILSTIGHRPWPLPETPWMMRQTWNNLLFAHWPIPVETMRSLIPPALPLDTFDGTAWVGIVPFDMSHVRPRLMPSLPKLSFFPELNVRTYVTLEDKPGVYFFSLDAGNRLAVAAARRFFHLPYFHADMQVELEGDVVHYRSRRIHVRAPQAELLGQYRPTGPVFEAAPGSLESWLTDRYCLYTLDPRGRVYRVQIHHLPWPLQPAEADFETNTMAAAHGIALPPIPPLLHFAKRVDMVNWLLEPVPHVR